MQRARTLLKKLERQHAAQLQGRDLTIGSAAFKGFLADFVQYKIRQLQQDLERQARVRMDVDALMPLLAERPGDQSLGWGPVTGHQAGSALLKTLERSAQRIDVTVERLRGWLTGRFVQPELLPDDLVALRASVDNWVVSDFYRAVFPWDEQPTSEGQSTEQLISRMVLRSLARRRAVEELQLLAREEELSMRLYNEQLQALTRAVAAAEDVQAAALRQLEGLPADAVESGCLEELAAGRAAHAAAGKLMLLEQHRARVLAIEAAAAAAYGTPDAASAPAAAVGGIPEYVQGGMEEDEGEEGGLGEE